MTTKIATLLAVASLLLLLTVVFTVGRLGAAWDAGRDFTADASLAGVERLIAYDRGIAVTAAQQRLLEEALGRLPSPCKHGTSSGARCCGCNLDRATWGLAKHLLVVEGLRPQQVIAGIQGWQQTLHGGGSAAHGCVTTHCYIGLKEDGCGGMHPERIVY